MLPHQTAVHPPASHRILDFRFHHRLVKVWQHSVKTEDKLEIIQISLSLQETSRSWKIDWHIFCLEVWITYLCKLSIQHSRIQIQFANLQCQFIEFLEKHCCCTFALCEFFVDYVDLILLHSTRCKLIPTLLVNPFLCQASAQVHDPVSGGWVDKWSQHKFQFNGKSWQWRKFPTVLALITLLMSKKSLFIWGFSK